MNKILTISIAAYNVENFIKKALDSLLGVNNAKDIEILVEDDGGTDNTANIVKEYEEKYPDIVKLIHKENGGYGSTINKSIELAQGKYFKQLDGYDWYDSENFKKFLKILRNTDADVVYTPYKEFYENRNEYVFKDFLEKISEKEYKVEEIILEASTFLNMYTLCYSTEILRKNKLSLLEKCFYTDTQYAMYPLLFCEKIYITHLPIYIYRLGIEGQSVNLAGHIKHYEDHVRVSKDIIDFCNKNKFSKNKQEYLLNYAASHNANTIAGFYLVLETNKKNLQQIKEFRKYIRENENDIYIRLSKQSKIVGILERTNYNYIVYCIMAKLKKNKLKNKYN